MARSRIWKKKPPEVVARNRAARAAEKAKRGPLPVPAQASPSVSPGNSAYLTLSNKERAVARGLIANYGMSVAGAVDAVREVRA